MGLEILGSFNDHDQYDGVFIGLKSQNWHLEFTSSSSQNNQESSNVKTTTTNSLDDLLVFYLDTEQEYVNLKEKLLKNNIQEIKGEDIPNPYWRHNGSTFLDPDNFRIVLSVYKLNF
eukprot:gene2156-2655_t